LLIGIDPRLNAEVLYVLRSMGHGDTVVLCDLNFPAASIAEETVHGELLRMENLTVGEAAAAVLSVLPLDSFAEDRAGRMRMDGQPDRLPPVQAEIQAAVDAAWGRHEPLTGLGRFEFYFFAKQAYAVIQTGERRFWGCAFLRKGVLPPDA